MDGIYFNTDQDFNSLNIPIKSTYESCDEVIFQSKFNRDLTFSYFGKKENHKIISNGTNIEYISKIEPIKHDSIDSFKNVWSCASSWRPHKRLSENIRYFLENSKKDECLVIAGENPDIQVSDPRIFYAGNLDWESLISLYKRSSYFIHLAFLDHCPNVVVDARAAGCKIICSSTGGTKEIAGTDAIVVKEDAWDFSPIKLYNPPKMDFSKKIENKYDVDISIARACDEYVEVFNRVRSLV